MPDDIYRAPNLKDKLISYAFVVMTIAIIMISSFYVRPVYGLIVHLIIIFFTIFLLILWHARKTAYLCPHCDHEFEISFWKDLISPSFFDKKLLKCPKCGIKDLAMELVKNHSPKI
jgi:DNA-directed RNA polymerase subunit RPC12/RpoP